MSIYSLHTTDAARKSSIVDFLTLAKSEAGALTHSLGTPIKGSLPAHAIRCALGCSTDITLRLLDELVNDESIIREAAPSGNAADWRYTVA